VWRYRKHVRNITVDRGSGFSTIFRASCKDDMNAFFAFLSYADLLGAWRNFPVRFLFLSSLKASSLKRNKVQAGTY